MPLAVPEQSFAPGPDEMERRTIGSQQPLQYESHPLDLSLQFSGDTH